MTTCRKHEEGTDIRDEITLRRRNIIVSLNKTGLIGVVFFAPLSFLFTCVWLGRCDILSLAWGGFGIHVLLMAGAFLLLAPMASITYRLLVDELGVTRSIAMKVHGYLQLASTAIGIVGVRAVYVAHEDSALTYFETGSYYVYHFRSSHSILGVFALAIYTSQLLAAFYIYFIGSKSLRAAYKQLHMAVGQGLIVVMVFVSALGMLYYESETFNLDWDDVGEEGYYRPYMTVAQYGMVFLMFSVILVFWTTLLV